MSYNLERPRRVISRRQVSSDAFVLRMERRADRVTAGKHINVGLPGDAMRAYSVYSAESDPWLEILVRRVVGGQVSVQLNVLDSGDFVAVESPKGRFGLAKAHPFERVLLLATGTGIAPFRSFILSHPELDYVLVHGVRQPEEDFGGEFASRERRVQCVSAPPKGWTAESHQTKGRVTDWLAGADLSKIDRVFLCGNARMMLEAVPALVDKGVSEDHIHTETYF